MEDERVFVLLDSDVIPKSASNLLRRARQINSGILTVVHLALIVALFVFVPVTLAAIVSVLNLGLCVVEPAFVFFTIKRHFNRPRAAGPSARIALRRAVGIASMAVRRAVAGIAIAAFAYSDPVALSAVTTTVLVTICATGMVVDTECMRASSAPHDMEDIPESMPCAEYEEMREEDRPALRACAYLGDARAVFVPNSWSSACDVSITFAMLSFSSAIVATMSVVRACAGDAEPEFLFCVLYALPGGIIQTIWPLRISVTPFVHTPPHLSPLERVRWSHEDLSLFMARIVMTIAACLGPYLGYVGIGLMTDHAFGMFSRFVDTMDAVADVLWGVVPIKCPGDE